MKRKTKYTDEPMGDELKVVEDFLPPPEQLVLKEDNVKITISLNKSSVEFFKKVARKQDTSYQKMIRNLLDRYATHYEASGRLARLGGAEKQSGPVRRARSKRS